MSSWLGVAEDLSTKLNKIVEIIENIDDEKLSDEDYYKLDELYLIAVDCKDTAGMMADNIGY